MHWPCADPESFVRGGLNLIIFFIDEEIKDPLSLQKGNHRSASGVDGPTLNAVLVAL